MDLTVDIVSEIQRAMKTLGAPEDVEASAALSVYRDMEELGADRELLAAVGSWGDSLDDEDVLEMLREWNSRHSIPDVRN
jgi:hypothetical protein